MPLRSHRIIAISSIVEKVWLNISRFVSILVVGCSIVATHNEVSAFRSLTMVEGHSVHRVASLHRKRLVGKTFTAWSPNGRFTDGANAINQKVFTKIEAVGKNLFAFFDNEAVVHVHFGMSGRWAVYDNDETPPEPTKTNRLRLESPDGIVADLSAMTVQLGDMELYHQKRNNLGEDPLRTDADPETLWRRIEKSKKTIGGLIMDQSFFAGPGNIYRAEILFKAGIHPNRPGNTLVKNEFDQIWHHTVALLERGYQTGSILTVDKEEAIALGKPKLRRYIYNSSKCPRCSSKIKVWQIASRTCYACETCQPLETTPSTTTTTTTTTAVTPQKEDCVPFNSHCARESIKHRLSESGPSRLSVKEIKSELTRIGVKFPSKAKKAELVELLSSQYSKPPKPAFVSPEEAALEKARAGESLAVEHIAELSSGQARRARVLFPPTDDDTDTKSFFDEKLKGEDEEPKRPAAKRSAAKKILRGKQGAKRAKPIT